MRKFFFMGVTLLPLLSYAQVGINTLDPKATLDVIGKPQETSVVDGIIAPRLTGDQLRAKDGAYGASQIGAIIYATTAANPTSTKTQNVTSAGYYYFNGTIWTSLKSTSQISTDATRFLGGTVYVKMAQNTGGTLPVAKVIGGDNGTNYTVGTLAQRSSNGGVNSIIGNGYTISNPQSGIFDIKFDVELTDIYGISSNLVDAYGASGGTNPISSEPGMRLFTNDNSQVSFVSNSIIRIKTGNSNGALSNRSFTFLITGK